MFSPVDALADRPLDELEAELCELSASIAAAQGRLLRVLGEYVERGGNERWEVLPDRWVSWKLGLGTGEARRTVALAERLRRLPQLLAECEEGRLAPSLAAPMSRVATPGTEAELIELAREAAPSKMERICRTKARIEADRAERERLRKEEEERRAREAAGEVDVDAGDDDADGEPPPSPPLQRYLSFGPAEGGGWELHAWFPSVEGARFQLGLERARMWLRGAGKPPHPDVVATMRQAWDTMGWADAGLLLAETVLAMGVHERRASERHRVVVHTDLDRFAAVVNGDVDGSDTVAYTANGAAVDAGTLARLVCSSQLVGLLEQAGRPVRIGDPTEVVPVHIERAVLARHDHMCDFPICGQTRGLELHHVIYRSHGGKHDPDLLVPLCKAEHTGLHLGGFTIETTDVPGRFRYFARDGTEITGRPPPREGPAPPLPCLDDASWAHERRYGDPLTLLGLDIILQRLFNVEEAGAAADAGSAAEAA